MTRILSVFNFLKRVGFALLLLGIFCAAAKADTTLVSGNVNGVWSLTGSPYIIQDTVTVLPEDSLLVTEGVEILIQDSLARFKIGGYCELRGTEADSVRLRLNARSVLIIHYSPPQASAKMLCDYVDVTGPGAASFNNLRRFQFSHSSLKLSRDYYNSGTFVSSDTAIYMGSRMETMQIVTARYLSMDSCKFVSEMSLSPGTILLSNTMYESRYVNIPDTIVPNSAFTNIWSNGASGSASFVSCHFNRVEYHITGGPTPALSIIDCIFDGGVFVSAPSFEVVNSALGDGTLYSDLFFRGTGTISECIIHNRIQTEGTAPINIINNTVIWDWPCTNAVPWSLPERYIFRIENPSTLIKNNIITACQGYVKLFSDSSAALNSAPSYNLISGMWDPWRGNTQGPGNVEGEPLFAPNSESYDLLYTSPAIDSGDPDLIDPDGTRSDIGARFWDHSYDHAPILLMPHEVTTAWGARLHVPFTAIDEQSVKFHIRSELPRWLNRYRLTGPDPREVNCIVPYGAESFQLILSTLDRVNRTVIDTIQVNIEPYSVLRDSVSGVLRHAYSPYYINAADAIVPAGDTLTIEPGVEIIGDGVILEECRPQLTVYGYLRAVGTEADSIIFRQADETYEFNGIFLRDSVAAGEFSYIVTGQRTPLYFEDCQRATIGNSTINWSIYSERISDSLIIRNCSFPGTTGPHIEDTRYTIENSIFDASGEEFYLFSLPNGGRGKVNQCTFLNLPNAIQFLGDNEVEVERCRFVDCTSSLLFESHPRFPGTPPYIRAIVRNNTFVNAAWVFCQLNFSTNIDSNFVEISNNIFQDSDDAVFLLSANGDTANIQITNNCFVNYARIFNTDHLADDWPSIGLLADVNVNGDSVDIYNNLISDPLFANGEYHLAAESPCIDAGYDYGAPYSGVAPDIGYWEYEEDSPPTINEVGIVEYGTIAFPNPFNPTTTLSFSLPKSSLVELTVYDVLGRVVMSRELGMLNTGVHDVAVDGAEWSSGVYFASVKAEEWRSVVKMALVR